MVMERLEYGTRDLVSDVSWFENELAELEKGIASSELGTWVDELFETDKADA